MHGLLCAPARGVAPPAGLCQAVVQHMLWLEARFYICRCLLAAFGSALRWPL